MEKIESISLWVLAVAATIIAIVPQWKDSKHKRLLIASVFISIGVAILSYLTGANSDEKLDTQTDNVTQTLNQSHEIKGLAEQDIRENKILRMKLDSQTLLIDHLRKENTELYFELRQTSREIYNQLTGGNSYCTANLQFQNSDSQGILVVANDGKYPLSFVNIVCSDLNIPNETPNNNRHTYFSIQNIPGHSSILTKYKYSLDKENGVNLCFNITYPPPKGMSFQHIRMLYVHGIWTFANKIEANGKVILKIDPNFPEKNSDKIFN
jgi:hypothetical protein